MSASDTKEQSEWIGVGLTVAAGVGAVLDNIAIGVAIGLDLGVAIGRTRSKGT